MKKFLYLFFCIPLIFGSCEEEDNTPSGSPPPPLPPSGTTGYYLEHEGSGYYSIFKTSDSGVSWGLQSTGNPIGSSTLIHFVD